MGAQYEVRHPYHSVGAQLGPWKAGEVVELEPEAAEWANRDSPGCLTAVVAQAVEPEPARQKPAGRDRQHRGTANRGA